MRGDVRKAYSGHLKLNLEAKLQAKPSGFLKKYTFSHSIPVNKIVLESSIYRIETIKIRFGSGMDFTSKNWLSPTKTQKNQKSPSSVFSHMEFGYHKTFLQTGNE